MISKLKWIFIGIVGCLAVVGGLWIWFAVKSGPAAVGKQLSEALGEKLRARPNVYLNRHVVVEEKRPIAELALVARATEVEHRMESELLYSRAKLVLRAVYAVKAGFNLGSPQYEVHLDSGLKKARLHLPTPRVLSLEMTRYEVLEDRDGWWNRISNADREMAMRQMQADAKLEAVRAGILQECKGEMEKQLAQVSRQTGIELEVYYEQPDPEPVLAPAASSH